MFLVVIIICLQGIVSAITPSSTECPVDDLQKSDVLECHVPNGINSDSEESTMKENTTCLTLKEDNLHYFTCIDGFWKDTSLDNYKNANKVYRTKTNYPHHTRHKRGFWKKVGNFFKGVARGVICVVSLFTACDTFGGRSGPSRDITPPVIKDCPAPIYEFAKPVQTYAVVVWEEPTAHDDKDGDIKPVRHGSGPHYAFSEERSPHHIKYIAKDNSGNTAECTVIITISVKRCPKVAKISNGYYICHPSTDYVLGASCRFGCYQGFELDGVSHITCTDQEIWSNRAPTCKPLTCPLLSPIEGARPECTNDNYFRSICSFNCDEGYDMPPQVSKALVCQNDKTWRKHGEPRCIDIEAPSFNTCPSIVIRGTDVGRTKGKLIWNEPTVEDNSGEIITPVQSSDSPKLESYQPAGTYVISYTASDAEGNKARDCVFKVVIRDSRCPRLYPTPYMQISCPHGYRTGALCSMSCDPGKVRVGKPDVKCEEASGGLTGNWNWGSQRTFCNVTNTCVQLKPPKNGALACDNWLGGELCQYQCKEKYDSFTDWKKLTVCQKSGIWIPHIEPFNCVQIYTGRYRQTHVDTAAEYYFSGDCTNETTKAEIQQNFITALNTSVWSVACLDEPNCHVDNVQVICGSSSEIRMRREAAKNPSKRASGYDNEISLITVKTRIAIKSSVNETVVDIQTKYVDVISKFETVLSDLVTDPTLSKFHIIFNGVINDGLRLYCPNGSVEAENAFSCIRCPEGSYFNTTSRECRPCGKATYQDELGQLHCKQCPLTTTTRETGSTDHGDCEDACEPGSSSSDGIVPCSQCEVGYYQSLYGQTDCVRCPGLMSTMSIGSTDITSCHEFDIELPGQFTKKISLQLHEEIVIEDFYVSFWIQRKNINSNSLNVSLLSSYGNPIMKLEDMISLIVDQESGYSANFTLVDKRWHKLLISTHGCILTVAMDGQATLETKLTNICHQKQYLREVLIDAEEDFVGGISQFNIGTGIYSAIAEDNRCFNTELPEFLSWYEFGAANMTGAFIRAPSECDDYDNCLSSPCYNGSCKDAINSFACDCISGFTGTQCEINIDDCSGNICMNNALCIDGVQNYTCACEENYTGTFCEIEMVNGRWGTWSNWSECSTTCGQGEHKRIRFCDSPVPDNGGEECIGNASDFTPCNNTACPVCIPIEPPDNGTITCSNDSGSLNCTIMCNEGFDFDSEPLDYYFCGPETFYEWNFKTVINPLHRLPECTAIKMPEYMSVKYNAKYKDLYCDGNRKAAVRTFINKHAEKVIQDLPCIKSQICSFEGIEIQNCDGLKRRKRATTTVDFQLDISTTPNNEDNGTEVLISLQDAFNQIQESADKGEFTIDIQGDEYEIDRNLTSVSGQAICPPGLTRVHFYCVDSYIYRADSETGFWCAFNFITVPCGKGSMLYTDYCMKCDIGFYQNMEGQTFCFQCPEDRTTLGVGSTTKDDCSVHLEATQDGLNVMAIVLGSSFGLAAILVFAVMFYRRKRCVQRRKISESMTGKSEGSLSVSPNPLLFVTPRSDSTAAVSSIRRTCMKSRFDSTQLASTLTTPGSVTDASEHENDRYGKAYNIPLQSMNHQDQRLDNDYECDIGTKKLTLLPEAQYRKCSYGGGNIAYPNMFGLMNKKPLNYKQTWMDSNSPQGDMK